MPSYHDALQECGRESALDDLLVLLWGAHELAHRHGQQPSDHPLEQHWLYRLGIDADLIALALARDYIQAATRSRSFSPTANALPAANSRLFLTEAGAVRAWQAIHARHGGGLEPKLPPRERPATERPRWDKTSGALYYGDSRLLTLSRPSSFQWMILKAFQQHHWKRHIDNPLRRTLGYRSKRLYQTLKDLNRRQEPHLLHFAVEEQGTVLSWNYRG